MFSETVKIKDSSGRSFKVEISTPTQIRLNFELARSGSFRMWRPHFWGGDWKVLDQGFIRYSSGAVWYKRSGGDIGPGITEGDIRHLDIFLCLDGEIEEDDWGIALYSFFSLNGQTSSGGNGYLDQPWVLQSQPFEIGWDIPGRYRSS